jgi:tellurite resistance protein TerC
MRWLALYWRHVPTPLRQTAVLAAGILLVLAGLAMLVLPGPGLVTILLGLVVLATEFAWAHHLLGKGVALVPARWRPGMERALSRRGPRDS